MQTGMNLVIIAWDLMLAAAGDGDPTGSPSTSTICPAEPIELQSAWRVD
jgi:hypothetical protein